MTKSLIPKEIDEYVSKYTSPESKVLVELSRETNVKVPLSIMLSGHIQGAFLQMVSHMVRPMQVLEIGTYTGYSAICLAQGLQKGGRLHTIDINEELEDICFRYFCEAGLEGSITQHIGAAADIIPSIAETFDIVFIDADKPNYELYFDLIIDKVAIGGMILADNVLYDGEVILAEGEQSKNARAMHAFNNKVKDDHRVEQLLLPLRDGIMMMRKVAS